jgi:hypothetical protein
VAFWAGHCSLITADTFFFAMFLSLRDTLPELADIPGSRWL